MNDYYYEIHIQDEQIEYATRLVDHSIRHHTVKDIFADDPDADVKRRDYRLTGTLGEVIYADAYNLERPTRSFGADDGQDHGKDFSVWIHGRYCSVDVKTMRRRSNKLRLDYVMNLPVYQIDKDSLTDKYYCISICLNTTPKVASIIGHVDKSILPVIANYYDAGMERVREDGSSFKINRANCEVQFRHINSPQITSRIESLQGFKRLEMT